jgi:hypothetical protein
MLLVGWKWPWGRKRIEHAPVDAGSDPYLQYLEWVANGRPSLASPDDPPLQIDPRYAPRLASDAVNSSRADGV